MYVCERITADSTEIDQMSVWQAAAESGNDYYVVPLPLPLLLHAALHGKGVDSAVAVD